MTMGDRVAVMRKGELQQAAEPQELYDHPVNLFVAGFIGSPAMNMLEATLQRDNGAMKVVTGSQEIPLGEETLGQRPALRGYEGRQIVLGIRPEDLEDYRLAGDAAHGGKLEGTVTLREALGAEIMVHFTVDAPAAITEDVKELAEDLGGVDRLGARGEERSTTMVGRFGARSRVKSGEQIDIAVDTRQLHFFDVDTGLGIYGDDG
jgi:multiple sugar transport system ATP-binding protein